MRILHISTFEAAGGAAIAAHRLHQGLRTLGHDSRMLVRDVSHEGCGADTTRLADSPARLLTDSAVHTLLYTAYDAGGRASADRLFSADLPTFDLSGVPEVQQADVVNVHWAAGMLSTPAIRQLQDLGKPVVWTLHDQYAFTGGCHYSGGCDGYTRDCSNCPHLTPAVRPLASLTLGFKRGWLDARRLHVVSPSRWLAECARRSTLLSAADIRTIPNAVSVDTFRSVSREEARHTLAVPKNALVILVGADRVDEPRKGGAHFIEALKQLLRQPEIRARFADRTLVLAAFGEGSLLECGVPVLRLGRLHGDRALAAAYRAADLFVLPTLEDNLPNTLLEAIAAGTPVVAYATGGVEDVLNHERGVLVPRGDTGGLASAVEMLLREDGLRTTLADGCERYAEAHLDLTVQASSYLRLYQEAIARRPEPVHGDIAIGAVRMPGEEDLLGRALGNAALSRTLLDALAKEVAANRELIAARGGEIRALQQRVADLASTTTQQAPGSTPAASTLRLGLAGSGFPPLADMDAFEWMLTAHASASPPSPLSGEGVAGRVSVIVPVYNASGFIEETLRSVWGQSLALDRIEIVLVDDGSTDGSFERALALQAVSPVRMLVRHHPGRANRGVSATRNLALAHATGELVALLDADDLFLPDRLARGVDYIARHPECRVLCSLGDNIDEHGAIVTGANGTTTAGEYRALSAGLQPPFTFEQLWDAYPVANSSLLIRRSALAEAGGYPPEMAHQAEDLLVVLKLSLDGPVHCLPDRLIAYRHHGGSYTTRYHAESFAPGVKLEVLYHLVHWMVCERPAHRERGVALFRRNYPLLLARSQRGRRFIDDLIALASGEEGLDAEAFLAARQREVLELEALRRIVPAALREARDARLELRDRGSASRTEACTCPAASRA